MRVPLHLGGGNFQKALYVSLRNFYKRGLNKFLPSSWDELSFKIQKISPAALFLAPFPLIIFKNLKIFRLRLSRQTFLFVLIKRRNITKYESAGSKPVHFFSFCIDIEKRRNKKNLNEKIYNKNCYLWWSKFLFCNRWAKFSNSGQNFWWAIFLLTYVWEIF